jgi:predicted Abi (CAAX) family protease
MKAIRRFIARFIALFLLTAIALAIFSPSKPEPQRISTYSLNAQLPFNQPSNYPIDQTIDPELYRPIGKWVGRLILPSRVQMQDATTQSDWVWLEVYTAPPTSQSLVGKKIRLEWSKKTQVQAYLRAVTTNVNFTAATAESKRKGNVTPDRLDRLSQVGPLRSLAGARPDDNVIVRLPESVSLQSNAESSFPILQIDQEPIQVTGRFYGLVKILAPEVKHCPSDALCPSEYFRVQHYNPKSRQFDGVVETVRIPQQPTDRDGIPQSTIQSLEHSEPGKAGWYIYGAKDELGVFVVQAIAPRSLFQLQPEKIILDQEAGLDYINSQNWQDTVARKGTTQTVLIDPINPIDPTETRSQNVPKDWRKDWHEGDRSLVMHLFGGIGGKKAESTTLATVTGHFAYGAAQVVRDPFTQELQFDLQYQQVYVHNPHGIIGGAIAWTNYMGDLQRGWIGTRPAADILINLPTVTQDYNFAGITLSPLEELLYQLQIMAARYRIGDGTGSADVTPATSCVQDSNQALFIAIQRIRQQVNSNPAIQSWLASHPNDPQTLRFQQLVSLGKTLEETLVPLGIVRSDWKFNAEVLAGIKQPTGWSSQNSLLVTLSSWRTIIPRGAQDGLARIFLNHGAKLWFMRTNQVGGWNADITPLAPTVFLGQLTLPFTDIPMISIMLGRLMAALPLPSLVGWAIAGGILLAYGAIALPLGFASGFLHFDFSLRLKQHSDQILWLFFLPVLVEELIFRVWLLAHPTEAVNTMTWLVWAVISLVLFIIYHPLNALTFYRAGNPTFLNIVFLTLAALLGIACTVAYILTGSMWTAVVMHWLVVTIWLFCLGGKAKLV